MKHTDDTHCSWAHRCGDPLPATPVADLQVGDLVVRTLDRHGAVGRVVSIDLDYPDPYAVVQFDDGNWSGARLAWTRVSNRETIRIAERKSKRAAQNYLGFCQDNATPGYVYSLVQEGEAFVVLATLIQV